MEKKCIYLVEFLEIENHGHNGDDVMSEKKAFVNEEDAIKYFDEQAQEYIDKNEIDADIDDYDDDDDDDYDYDDDYNENSYIPGYSLEIVTEDCRITGKLTSLELN